MKCIHLGNELCPFMMFIIYSKERKTAVTHTHTQHRNKLLLYTITLIYKYIHSRKKNMT